MLKMGPSMEEDYRMQDATFCSCFHVFMAQIIAVIKNNKNKMAGQDQDDRIGSWFLRTDRDGGGDGDVDGGKGIRR